MFAVLELDEQVDSVVDFGKFEINRFILQEDKL